MKHILFLICIALGVKACYPVDGDRVDSTKFSKKEVSFSAQGGADTVTTQGTRWWMATDMLIDGKQYYFASKQDTTTGLSSPCCFKTEDGEDVSVTKSDAELGAGVGVGKIEGPWFIIAKATKQMLTFTIAPNETGKPRTLVLAIDERVLSHHITVSQAAE
jgi:hypothetical protein